MHCARRAIKKFEPGVIAITGGIGKTTTQAALIGILADIRSMHTTSEEISEHMRLPFAALGIDTEDTDILFSMRIAWKAFKTAYISPHYPELLILECPEGRSREFTSLTRPQITIVTAIAKENEADAGRLLGDLPSNGYAVICRDDERARAIALRTRARAITFGFEDGVDLVISNLAYRSEKAQGIQKPAGISFTATYGNQSAHIAMDNAFGKAAAYAAAAAMCVGTAFGLHLARTAGALRYIELPKGRMSFLIGKKGTYVVNDTGAETEEALLNALEAISSMPAKRVIGVFGTARKRGDEWRMQDALNKLAIKACDAILTVGEGPINVDSKKKIHFNNGEAAAAELQAIIERDDLVLVSGQGLEAVIETLGSISKRGY